MRYAARGWPVFPLHTPVNGGCSCGNAECKSVGKHPRTHDGLKSGTTDEGRIKGWWRTWSAANIGIVCGAKSGFFVLDIDPDHGGDASLGMLTSRHGQMPQTVEALTGSGGRHLLFRHPGRPVPNSTQRLGAGLDVRGDGGYIVAAPSLHKSGRKYEWQPGLAPADREIAPAPEWLLELLKPRPVLPMPNGSPEPSVDRAYQRAQQYIARMPPAIQGSNGSGALWDVAIVCTRGFRLSESETLSLILSDYNPRCDPPWSEKEVLHKIRDVQCNGSVPFGYLLDNARPTPHEPRLDYDPPPPDAEHPTPPSREPGSDDGDPRPALAEPFALPVSSLLAEEIPLPRWLIDDYLQENAIALVAGPPGVGKTLLVFDWSAKVAAAGRKVFIAQNEGSKFALQKRLRRSCLAANLDPPPPTFTYRRNLALSLSDHRAVQAFAKKLVGYDLIVLDSLASCWPGLNENDAEHMSMVAEALKLIAEITGAAVVGIHHTTKATWKNNEQPSLGEIRGHGAMAGRIDAAFICVPPKERVGGVVRFDVHTVKQRDVDWSTPRAIEVLMTGPAATVTTEPIAPAPTAPADKKGAKEMKIEKAVLKVAPHSEKTAVSRNEICRQLDDEFSHKAAVLDAISRLLDRGVLRLNAEGLVYYPRKVTGPTGEYD